MAELIKVARRVLLFTLAALVTTGIAQAQLVRKLEVDSGDRQIVIGSRAPTKPFGVRALDGQGVPVVGAKMFIGPGADNGFPHLYDEFTFRGFNTVGPVSYTAFGFLPPEYIAFTNAQGVAQAQGGFVDYPPSAFTVAAGQLDVPYSDPPTWVFFSVVLVAGQPAGNPSVVLEYFNSDVGHYFNTLFDSEIAALEAGEFRGWKRSTGSFIAYATKQDAPADAVPVCRFFGPQFTSHFYTADPTECELVVQKWPDVWLLETRAAFYVQVPDKATGACGAGLQRIYRLYNNRPNPSHRFVADAKLRDRMVGAGWIVEGYGPGVVMCAPA